MRRAIIQISPAVRLYDVFSAIDSTGVRFVGTLDSEHDGNLLLVVADEGTSLPEPCSECYYGVKEVQPLISEIRDCYTVTYAVSEWRLTGREAPWDFVRLPTALSARP